MASPGAKFCAQCGEAVGPPKLVFGDYEVLEVIGEGGMGRVYKARQKRLNRLVCIKTLLPQFSKDAEVSQRFEKEALTTARLSHPNIVSVFDVGHAPDGGIFIVMELVEGRTLRMVLRDEAPLDVERSIRLVDQVLAALGEAHTHAVVHRDLKPGNVLVTALRDGGELCKVVDFGIARVMAESGDERLTRSGMMLGTPGYMAPEQIYGEDYDHRVDVYAAGVLLYELVTGQRLFRAPNDNELLKKVLLETPAPPSTRTPGQIPKALDEVCLKALSRDPRTRYSSASDFREALAQCLRNDYGGSDSASGLVFSSPSRVEYTPLAVAVPESRSSQTNTRSLVAAVLAASDEWERARLLDPFERAMREAITAGELEGVRAAISSLQSELRERGNNENLKALVNTTRALILDLVPGFVEDLENEQKRSVASWFLKLLGRKGLPTFLALLPSLSATRQRLLMTIVRSIDSDFSALAQLTRSLDPKVLKPMLVGAREWPEDQPLALFAAALQSTDPAIRLAGLEALDERVAFRLGALVRQRLHDPVVGVRGEALRWVFRTEDESAVPDLVKLLERSSVLPAERRAVWRTLAHINSEEAVRALLKAFGDAREVDQLGELATLLVRTGAAHAVQSVRNAAGRTQPQRVKRVLEEALREVSA